MYKSRERLSSFFLPGISQPPGQDQQSGKQTQT